MKERKDLLDFFEHSARQLEQQPPDRVWEQLDQRLQQAGLHPKTGKPKKALIYLLRIGSVAASMALLVFLSQRFFVKNTSLQAGASERGVGDEEMVVSQAPMRLENLLYDEGQSFRMRQEIHLLYQRYKALGQEDKKAGQ